MLNTQLVANFLEEQLNLYGAELPYKLTFGLSAELKDESRNSFIQGIVRTVDAPAEPVRNYIDMKYVLNVDLLVPARSNKFIIQVNEIVGKIIKAYNDTRQDFGNGYGIITFSAPHPLKYDINYGKGDSVPLSFTVRVTFTETSTVTSSTKHWIFEGIEIPFISESVTVETEGVTRKIYSEQYNKTLKTGQQRFYNFTVPYTSRIGILFQKIILNSSITENSTYELTYYDEDAFPQGEPFKTTVILYRSGRSGSAKPNASAFDITFTDADGLSATDYPQYYLGLLDFPFDNQSEDTRYFSSRSEQSAYFEGKIGTWGKFKRIAAPNLNSIDITRQIYPNDGTYPLFDLAKKNYAVIKTISGENAAPQYFYYFITGCEIGAGGQISYDLHLDTVQTYFFDPSVSFADCLIERAHLNRFEEVEGQPDYVKFVTDPATKIYNAEDALNYPKRLTKRTKLGLASTGNQAVDEWLNEYVLFWVYVYVNLKHRDPNDDKDTNTYTIISVETKEEKSGIDGYSSEPLTNDYKPSSITFEDTAIISQDVSCFCYPVYRVIPGGQSGQIFASNSKGKLLLDYLGESGFRNLNNDASYYLSKKVSIVPPFALTGSVFEVSGNTLTIKGGIGTDTDVIYYGNMFDAVATRKNNNDLQGIIFINSQYIDPITTNEYLLPYNNNILKNDVKNGTDRLSYNPKLNSQNFKELIITAASGDTFAYDIQKLQNNSVSFLYTEPLQPETTKYYMRVNPCGLYAEGTENNYMGLIGSTDNSLAVANDQYAAFLANNKNFWLQSNMKIATGTIKSLANIGGNIASSKNPAISVANGAAGVVGTGLDLAVSLVDRNMTIDNLRNAPDQMKNANGNVIFNAAVTDLGLYVEEFSALDGDLKSAFDFMELYGFSVNAIGNVKDYANIRKFHNYIKAQVQAISGALSNTSRADLRQRFANGVRFWSQDTPDYSQENYENWLDEE